MSHGTADASAAHALQCLGVWGGSQAIVAGLSVPGIDASVSSSPYGQAANGGDVHYLSMCGEGRISRPVPAVYLVDREGIIRFAHWNPDYKKRLDSNELLDAARRASPETPRKAY